MLIYESAVKYFRGPETGVALQAVQPTRLIPTASFFHMFFARPRMDLKSWLGSCGEEESTLEAGCP